MLTAETLSSIQRAVTAYLGLGSNLGDRLGHLRAALQAVAERVQVADVSSVYETAPWGVTDQPAFLNAVVAVRTAASPERLMCIAKEVEREVGRSETFRWGPREIDVDVLLIGDLRVERPDITVPHPRLHERAFVLVPLAEIAPEVVHPVLGKSVADLAAEVPGREGVRLWGRLPT